MHNDDDDDDDDDDGNDDYDDYDYDNDDDCTSAKMKPLPARLLGAPYSPGVSLVGTENIINHTITSLSSVTSSFVPSTPTPPPHPSDKQAC